MEKIGNLNKNESENRDERSDVLLRFLNTAENIKPLRSQKFESVFSDDGHKREFINKLDTEDFFELLNGINGILRDKDKKEWIMDGENVFLEAAPSGWNVGTKSYMPPRQEDKPGLLEEVLLKAKEMNQENRDLDDIALLISASINAIHPYLDANGRMSRLIYSLFTKNFDNESRQELKRVLSEHGREEVNIDPGFIQGYLTEFIRNDLGIKYEQANPDAIVGLWPAWPRRVDESSFREDINKDDKKLFLYLLDKDGEYLFFSLYKLLENGQEKEKYIKKFPKFSRILINEFIKDLTPEKMRQVLNGYRDFKKEYVEKLINSIATPDRDEYKIVDKGRGISLRDYFEDKIKEDHEKRAGNK